MTPSPKLLADDELAQAQHDEWVCTKLAAARADTRPTVTADEVMARLGARYASLSSAASSVST